MTRRHTAVQQPGSARRAVAAAGILHNDVVNASLVVGVTPAIPATAENPGQPQIAHFCSSRVLDPVILREGDGQPVPSHDEYQVVIRGGLPLVTVPCLMMVRTEICPNGSITLKHRNNRARIVPVPASLLPSRPYAFADGPDQMARAYGCPSVQRMFDTVGQEVAVS